MNIWTALVIIVAIVAFAAIRLARYRALGHRQADADGSAGRDAGGKLEREIVELRQRLAVLERIATDDRHGKAIAHEIEQLRER